MGANKIQPDSPSPDSEGQDEKNEQHAHPSVLEANSEGNVLNVRLKNGMGWGGILAAGFSTCESWVVFSCTLIIPLLYGFMATIWGIIVTGIVYIAVAITMAELVSTYPTIGGQYHWTSILAPKRFKQIASYFLGFTSWLSWILICSSVYSGFAITCVVLMSHANPDLEVQLWHYFLFFQLMNLTCLLVNIFSHNALPKIYMLGFGLSFIAAPAISITLLAYPHERPSSSDVFTMTIADYGWPVGVQFLIGLASPVQAFCAIDGAVHLVEEVNHASKTVPRAIFINLLISFTTTLLLAFACLYSISDIYGVLGSSSPFLLYEIARQAIPEHPAVAVLFTSFVFVALIPCSLAVTQVASNMACSLGRDNIIGTPKTLSRINPTFGSPITALILNACLVFLVGCLYFASTLALNTIIGVSGLLQQVTMAVPALLLLLTGRSASCLPESRPFKVPQAVGWTCNIIVVLWTALTTVMFLFPTQDHVETSTMNYALVVVFAIIIFGTVNWFIHAWKHYKGPLFVQLHE